MLFFSASTPPGGGFPNFHHHHVTAAASTLLPCYHLSPFSFLCFFFHFQFDIQQQPIKQNEKKRKQPLLFNYYYYDKKITSTRSVFHTSTHINYLLQTTHA